ncbi:squalene--hopene cyclase [Mangrovactinospora gilvigrisea]|uniref:Squalene--hopene cyclase n=1 Tax=Mangrovactinospora gilvigrisea TaxID=1428644 RepID=A0A1J7BB01_9ACTN|nr:squalene--hopene cyclase [Mangrovactinospora gilvigrisea]OIV35827.1 squalene--hopene cyclase [Mangrovactinospora gilvigrisea]
MSPSPEREPAAGSSVADPAAAAAAEGAVRPGGGDDAVRERAAETLRAASDNLLARQSDEGWWKGDLETNITMDAEDLLLREFLGIRDAERTESAARWVRSQQQDDGTWATFYGGPSDLSATIEGYVALRLAGDDPEAPHMAAASAWVRKQGGIVKSRVFTRIWLALFGWWPWERLPEMPPEIMFLPKWMPLNIYSFASWARQTIVPLTVVGSRRPRRPAPFRLDELHADPEDPYKPAPPAPAASWEGVFQRLDKILHVYHKHHSKRLRKMAKHQAVRWIIERQENDGCFGGIQPPAVYSLMALYLEGYDIDHPVMRAGLKALDDFSVARRGGARMVEACQSPVWDTCLAVVALADAGLPRDHPALVRAGDWMVQEEVAKRGDWAVQRPRLGASGFAFEFQNDNYPDVDDTAEVVLALRRVDTTDNRRRDAAIRRAANWAAGMQSKDGAWGAFDADNTSRFPNRLPFCDFGEVIDPPSADVTAHMVEMLADLGFSGHPRTRRGVAWLLREQEPDGSWFGRWGVNYIYGTGSVVPALVTAGIPVTHPSIRRSVTWLEEHQNTDGGWGEDLRSYHDPSEWAGRGESTASQTAWALMALLAAGEDDSEAVRRGVEYLGRTQQEDGSWDEPQFTGTGFPWDFSINYHLYRMVWPITALGRYVHGGPADTHSGSPAVRTAA